MMGSIHGLRVAIVSAILALPVMALAGQGGGQITDLHIENMIGFIAVTTTANQPSCDSQQRFVFDLNQQTGRAMYFAALAALQRGRPVSIQGTGACEVKGDSETVLFIGVP